jgi:transposase
MRGAVHMQIATIGLDIAKNVFQVHGIDAAEKVIVRKQLRRGQVIALFARHVLWELGASDRLR